MKKRFEWLYDKRKNETTLFIWQGMKILDTRTFNGQVDKEHQKRIEQNIKDEDWEELK